MPLTVASYLRMQTQQALEQVQFALERETARRVRLDKKYSELEERGLVSPRSVSPRVWRPETSSRKASGEVECSQTAPPTLPRPSSARCVFIYHSENGFPRTSRWREGSVRGTQASCFRICFGVGYHRQHACESAMLSSIVSIKLQQVTLNRWIACEKMYRLFCVIGSTDSDSKPAGAKTTVWNSDVYPSSEDDRETSRPGNVYRMVLEEARAKLGQDNDAFTSTTGWQEVHRGQQGTLLDSRGSTLEGISPRAGKGENHAGQSASPL